MSRPSFASLSGVLRWFAFAILLACGWAMATVAAAHGERDGSGARHDQRAVVEGYFWTPQRWILPSGSEGRRLEWAYTTVAPPADWMTPGFRTTADWRSGKPGFWGGETPRAGDAQNTLWPDGATDLWLRKSFRIHAGAIPHAMFWGRVDDRMEVYVNGTPALIEAGWSQGYRYYGLSPEGRAALRADAPNTLAVHVRDDGGARYFDLGIAQNPRFASMPSTGYEKTPELAVYAETVRAYMQQHGIPAGVLAVMKGDEVVVKRGFGWSNKGMRHALEADAVMRLASNDKVITTGAIARLIDTGAVDPATGQALTWDTPVFPLLRAHGLAPTAGHAPDPRIDSITVRVLHQHQAGLQELPAPEVFYRDLGVPSGGTTTTWDPIRWTYGMPLEFTPGEQSRYSSIGYAVLRHVVHVVSGDLSRYLRDQIFAPAGSAAITIAHERLRDRDPTEPWYATLEAPYNRWIYLEDYTALAASAEAMVRYLRRYSFGNGALLIDPVTGQWGPGPEGNGAGVFVGSMPGTWSVSVQRRWDEVSFAVVFDINGAYDDLIGRLMEITDGLAP